MVEVINSFKGEYLFLSNFDTAPFRWRGIMFKSGEQAFSYAKHWHCKVGTTGEEVSAIARQIIYSPTPSKAKYWGRRVPLNIDEWDTRKVHYMREIVHAKFSYVKDYAGKLINTGASPLVEGNDWNDGFWGKYRNSEGVVVGLNMLGTILMEERGYWLWGRQPVEDMLGSVLTSQQAERTADYA